MSNISTNVIVRPHKEVTKPSEGPEGGSWLKPDKLVTKAEQRSLANCLAEANYHPEGPSNGSASVTNLYGFSQLPPSGPSNGLVTDLRGLSVLENGA